MPETPRLKLHARLYCGDEIAMGPGKADLLEAIGREGSISAAARAMGMSYRRAWLLVDAMNRCWAEPLVETVAGGSHERGARLSALGEQALLRYRALQDLLAKAEASEEYAFLKDGLRREPLPSQSE
ncbi:MULTISPECIES: winged helix-turn-helix domain-containing protein [Novosphingobium]|uniref:Molybdate transport system regulatory protein n=1 Tax=Novosphingobium mathurense TaxID=428990 RepID=A0A1U6GS42_9SPHN|nr:MULTISPECIES: LysR family transcriptional regulator [Novosphingobium]CDO36972.1 putative transcriptional regulator, ModE family [Novosphingobium sp. KN65.2]SLJ86337.1 molybdate transport system regulatory protein [Novosphingobium mathurense]